MSHKPVIPPPAERALPGRSFRLRAYIFCAGYNNAAFAAPPPRHKRRPWPHPLPRRCRGRFHIGPVAAVQGSAERSRPFPANRMGPAANRETAILRYRKPV